MKKETSTKDCPICGQKMKEKTSFKGRTMHRNKRKTYVCNCSYSTIVETEREIFTRKGFYDEI